MEDYPSINGPDGKAGVSPSGGLTAGSNIINQDNKDDMNDKYPSSSDGSLE